MTEGDFPKSDGDFLYASEINSIKENILQIDTSTDLDFSESNNEGSDSGTQTKDYTISSSDLKHKDYLCIRLVGEFYSYTTHGTAGTGYGIYARTKVKLENTTLSTTIVEQNLTDTTGAQDESSDIDTQGFYEYIYPLTTDDKNDGFTLRITTGWSYETKNDGTCATKYTNKQIVLRAL
jgi:outer membrane protein assembly factor BamA